MTASSGGLGQIALTRSFVGKLVLSGGDRFLNRITRLQTLLNRGRANAVSQACRSAVGIVDAVNRHRTHVTLILGSLLYRCCPSAVSRFVVSVGVQPVDRMVERRAFAHIGKKRDKRVLPSLTDANAAPAILREVLVADLFAPRLHADPNTIGRASFAANFMAVLQSSVRVSHSRLNSKRPLKMQAKAKEVLL